MKENTQEKGRSRKTRTRNRNATGRQPPSQLVPVKENKPRKGGRNSQVKTGRTLNVIGFVIICALVFLLLQKQKEITNLLGIVPPELSIVHATLDETALKSVNSSDIPDTISSYKDDAALSPGSKSTIEVLIQNNGKIDSNQIQVRLEPLWGKSAIGDYEVALRSMGVESAKSKSISIPKGERGTASIPIGGYKDMKRGPIMICFKTLLIKAEDSDPLSVDPKYYRILVEKSLK